MIPSVGTTLDFAPYVSENTQNFTGREGVFQVVDAWLSAPRSRNLFLLTGEPGSGKSAIAARFVQISEGDFPASEYANLEPGFLSAFHFCRWREQRWINPFTFVSTIATQLANRFPAYEQILLEQRHQWQRNVQINARVEQQVEQVAAGGHVAGLVVEVGGSSAEDAFNLIVREPLEQLLRQGAAEHVVILVDGLDEALAYSGATGIVPLLGQTEYLHENVRFVLTTRPVRPVLEHFDTIQVKSYSLTTGEGREESHRDVRRYVEVMLEQWPQIIARLTPELSKKSLVDAIEARSDGNFLYAQNVLRMLREGDDSLNRAALEALPEGLTGIYLDSLQRLTTKRREDWPQKYAPVLGTLAVAQAALTEEQLAGIVDVSRAEVRWVLATLRSFLDVSGGERATTRTYAIYHRSFADFLLDPDRAGTYWCEPAQQHKRIAQHYLKRCGGVGWHTCDAYGLGHTPTHLAEAARGQAPAEQHALTEKLVSLTCDLDYQKAYRQKIDSLVALRSHLQRALQCAAEDVLPEALPLVVQSALALTAFDQEQLEPESLFELAREGRLEDAERRLGLFGPDPEWRIVIRSLLAWLAADQHPVEARNLRESLREDVNFTPVARPEVELLLQHLDAALGQEPPPEGVLPPAPPDYVVHNIIERLGGGAANETGLEPLNLEAIQASYEATLVQAEGLQASGDAAPAFLADVDGPPLIAYAAAHPEEGTALLRQYIALHASNPYAHYRNRSLRGLLAPVLQHPDPAWAQEIAKELATAALAGSHVDYREALPAALQAIRAQAGDRPTRSALEEWRQQAEQAAASLAPERGQGDPFATHLRRLGALAEIYARGLNEPGAADELLDQALALPYGFAGFRAPACLTLAEAVRICRPHDQSAISQAVEASTRAAHNIQDYKFCAATTARVNAMRMRWWGGSFDPVDVAQRFADAPQAAEFSAVYVIGEDYAERTSGPQKLPLPSYLLSIDSFYYLSNDVFAQVSSALRGANPDLPDEHIPPGEHVNIPDPQFTPLLVARLSAELLIQDTVSKRQRVAALQALVPLAVTNPTALSVVLARLILLAAPQDADVLSQLESQVLYYMPEVARGVKSGQVSGAEPFLGPNPVGGASGPVGI